MYKFCFKLLKPSLPVSAILTILLILGACDNNTAYIDSDGHAPVANAGTDINVASGKLIELNGEESSDADGDNLSYRWELLEKPVGSDASIQGADTSTPTITPDVDGVYIIQLIVNDGKVDSPPKQIKIIVGNVVGSDRDGDGIPDDIDAFPDDATESLDTDDDGIGNNADTDDDGDGVADTDDAFPLDAKESLDTDDDGIGNNTDADDDNDGFLDADDAFPLDATESLDTDGDGTGNNADTDDDDDGVADVADAFPLDVNESADTDHDGIGNNADTDDDNDGVLDVADAFPLNVNENIDTDHDGIGNNTDTDDDNDGVADADDAFPLDANENLDTDGDGIGNNADTDDDNDGIADVDDSSPLGTSEGQDTGSEGAGKDTDGDGVADSNDAFPLDANESTDTDHDGIGNNADTDDDDDGVVDTDDAFPLNANESTDTDHDGIGNNADADDDGDGVVDTDDAFPLDANESADTDDDGIGNNADTDDDGDGVVDTDDVFPLDANESADTDDDGIGNNTDTDDDGDGVADTSDAFPLDANESLDTDGDGTGNNADMDDDGDGVADTDDIFPLDATETVDLDGDGIGDNADPDRDGDGIANNLDDYPDDKDRNLLVVDIKISTPVNGFSTVDSTVEVVGSYSGDFTSIKVQDVDAILNNGEFRAVVDIREGINKITAVGFYNLPNGDSRGVNATRNVIKDTTAPEIIITTIEDGMVTTESEITIAGSLDDLRSNLSSVSEPTVTVNGLPVDVINRSFERANFLLQPGANNIRIVATDALGNSRMLQRTINYINNAGQRVIEVEGNNQRGLASSTLPEPLVVKLVDRNNVPVINRAVSFKVKEGDGIVTDLPREGRELTVITNEQGLAQVNFRLGGRHGAGKHQVLASSIGFPAPIVFSATAETLPANRISVARGNYQTGMMDSALPEPVVARVTDVNGNPVQGADVNFVVSKGDGKLVGANGIAAKSLTVRTDIDGNVSAEWVMGNNINKIGNNSQVIKVAVVGSEDIAELTTNFTATNYKAGPVDETSVTGLVLDNSNVAMPDVEVKLSGDHFATLSTTTDAEGRFKFLQAPVGTVYLGFDGSTTTKSGEYPKLMFELVTVSGQENTVGMPIYIPTLNFDGGKIAGGDQEVIIPMKGVEGGEVILAPNSVTFLDGRKQGLIMFSQVQTDKIPMPAPNGSVFDVAWTLQPSGTIFDPPARISLPNANGGKPGEEQEMFSFDHDLMEWVSIGPGVVSEDGSKITSREGFGVRHAGWGGAPPPPPPPTCNISCDDGNECTSDSKSDCFCTNTLIPDKVRSSQVAGNCQTELCAGSRDNNGDKPPEECGTCTQGRPNIDITKALTKQEPDDCKLLMCGGDDKPQDETAALQAKGGDFECKYCKDASIDNLPNILKSSCGDGTPAQSCYTCKDGSCGNHCEVTTLPITIESDVPSWIFAALTGIENIANQPTIFTANLNQEISVKVTSGEECCVSCETAGPQEYEEYSGFAGVKGTLQVTIPGLGVAKEMPPKIIGGGYVFKASIFATIAGAEIALDAGATVAYKNTQCSDENCGTFTLGTSVKGSFGPQINGSASFDSCVSADCKDSIPYVAIQVKGGGVLNVGGNFQSRVSSKASCGASCFGGNIDPTTLDAYFSASITIVFQKFTYSAKKSLELHPGGPIGNSCN